MNSKRRRESYDPGSVEYIGETMVEMDTFEYIWEIHKISEFSLKLSPEFDGGLKTKYFWTLKATGNDNGSMNYDEDYSSFRVRLSLVGTNPSSATGSGFIGIGPNPIKSFPKQGVSASFQLSLLGPDNAPWKIAPKSHVKFTSKNRDSQYCNLITMEELRNVENGLVVNDAVKILCQIWVEGTRKHTVCPGGMLCKGTPWIEHGIQEVARDLKIALESGSYSDVSLVTSTKTFPAHKFMLTARSRVFQAMFASPMLESAGNSVNILDFEESVVQAMLEYIYSGKTPSLVEKALDLLRIADKYEVSGLKRECEETLGRNLEIETAAETLIVAHMHNVPQLKAKLFSFINKNKEKVNKTEGFKSLKQVDLLMELYLSQK